jgi:hypothetical protein
MEDRAAIKFCVKLKKTATKTFEMLKSAYGEEYLSRTSVFEWHKRFKEGQKSLQDDDWKGHPSTSRTQEFVPEKQTVNGKFYKEVITRLIARVHRIRPEFQESGSWYLLQDNERVHSLGIVSEFLVKRGIPVLSLPPYSPDLLPADFFLFPKSKIAMIGMRFEAVLWIQQTVRRELEVIPEEVLFSGIRFFV